MFKEQMKLFYITDDVYKMLTTAVTTVLASLMCSFMVEVWRISNITLLLIKSPTTCACLPLRVQNSHFCWPVEVQQALPALGLEVLDVLCLIQDQVPPRLASEGLVILQHQLVRSDAHMESIGLSPALKKRQTVMVKCVIFRKPTVTTFIIDTYSGEKRLHQGHYYVLREHKVGKPQLLIWNTPVLNIIRFTIANQWAHYLSL